MEITNTVLKHIDDYISLFYTYFAMRLLKSLIKQQKYDD